MGQPAEHDHLGIEAQRVIDPPCFAYLLQPVTDGVAVLIGQLRGERYISAASGIGDHGGDQHPQIISGVRKLFQKLLIVLFAPTTGTSGAEKLIHTRFGKIQRRYFVDRARDIGEERLFHGSCKVGQCSRFCAEADAVVAAKIREKALDEFQRKVVLKRSYVRCGTDMKGALPVRKDRIFQRRQGIFTGALLPSLCASRFKIPVSIKAQRFSYRCGRCQITDRDIGAEQELLLKKRVQLAGVLLTLFGCRSRIGQKAFHDPLLHGGVFF